MAEFSRNKITKTVLLEKAIDERKTLVGLLAYNFLNLGYLVHRTVELCKTLHEIFMSAQRSY